MREALTMVGSHSWRAGFSTMSTPYVDSPNVIARYRERKIGKNMLLFGNYVDADANSRSNTRNMFDGDLLIHGDLLVSLRYERAADVGRNVLSITRSLPLASTRTG